jgi:hypothetical protein
MEMHFKLFCPKMGKPLALVHTSTHIRVVAASRPSDFETNKFGQSSLTARGNTQVERHCGINSSALLSRALSLSANEGNFC